jgi:hypothetical protein
MRCLRPLFVVLLVLSLPKLTDPQTLQHIQMFEVILKTYDVTRTETLVYLRVFSDGSAEAHPMREVDFRTLALKQAQISPNDLAKLREILNPSNTQRLEPKYEQSWGNKDFGSEWRVTIGQGESKKTVVLENFQPFLARSKKKPYPEEIEKLGCIVWKLRTEVTGEPLERNYLRGCQDLGY